MSSYSSIYLSNLCNILFLGCLVLAARDIGGFLIPEAALLDPGTLPQVISALEQVSQGRIQSDQFHFFLPYWGMLTAVRTCILGWKEEILFFAVII